MGNATRKRRRGFILGSLPLVVVLSGLDGALAQVDAAPEGCFERIYPGRHMREHPGQIVRHIIVNIGWDEYSKQNMFGVQVWLLGKKQVWRAGGSCRSQADAWICRPDTDGDPEISARSTGDRFEFSNPKRLKVYDDVTGPGRNEEQVAGPANLKFVLMRANPAKCKVE